MEITDLVWIDATGYHFSDYPSFLTWLTGVYTGIYGADADLDPDTQDGQFLSILAQAFYDTAALGGSVYNSFSPVTSQGLGLARLVKINGLEKGIPTNSQVELQLVGTAGTAIENGIAIDTLQQQWDLPALVTIGGGGTVTCTAVAQDEGAITAAANTVTGIYTPTLGWQTVNNSSAATPGAPIESDSTLRQRQIVSTANPSLTVLEGTQGAIANLAGVTKVLAYENDTGSTDANGVYEHSVAMAVVGGDDTQICQAIQVHKTPGAGTFGNTNETVYDSHGMPIDIYFNRPSTAEITVVVTLAAGEGWSADFIPEIQNQVAAYINSLQIGGFPQGIISLSKLYAPAYLIGDSLYPTAGLTYSIASIAMAISPSMPSSSDITLTYNQNPYCNPSVDVSVVVT